MPRFATIDFWWVQDRLLLLLITNNCVFLCTVECMSSKLLSGERVRVFSYPDLSK